MRISVRQGEDNGAPAVAPAEAEAEEMDVEVDRKRPRVTKANGSVMGSAPGTDEAARGVGSGQDAKAPPRSRNPQCRRRRVQRE